MFLLLHQKLKILMECGSVFQPNHTWDSIEDNAAVFEQLRSNALTTHQFLFPLFTKNNMNSPLIRSAISVSVWSKIKLSTDSRKLMR
jgi:hypothetical protein